MVNIRRRTKQAHNNLQTLFKEFHTCITEKKALCDFSEKIEIVDKDDVNRLIKLIEAELTDIANTIEPDWAIPVLIELIGSLYYGAYKEFKRYGPACKRALAYLWKNSFVQHGVQKNINQLVQLLTRSFVLERLFSSRRVFLVVPNYHFSFYRGCITIPDEFISTVNKLAWSLRGRGKRLRVAETNSMLMSNPQKYFDALISILNGEDPLSLDIFKNTFFVHIPGTKNPECRKFWKQLFVMFYVFLFVSLVTEDATNLTDVVILPEFAISLPENMGSQENILPLFWRKDWFDHQDSEQYSSLIVSRPILRISESGYFATSLALLGDSINYFLEQQIMKIPNRNININLPDVIFKRALSEPFEKECINYLRTNGFVAGCVNESGTWMTQYEHISLKSDKGSLYGEIDVLAYHPNLYMLLLIECKVLRDISELRTYKNLISKLNDDSEAFRYKLLQKSEWVTNSFFNYSKKRLDPLLILLTDIPFPILFNDDRVELTDFEHLKLFIKKALSNLENPEL